MFLTSYLDDSGSDDLSPLTAIGGPVMSKDAHQAFEGDWTKLLDRYQIPPPLHMNDFVRPHGKHIGMYPEMKMALFREACDLINAHKLYSISVSIPQPDFGEAIPDEARKQLIGPYALAFFCAVMLNQDVARRKLADNHVEIVVSYLVDQGFGRKEQLDAAHSILLKHEALKGGFQHTGAMGYDIDDRIAALQAADVVAWSARRRDIGRLTEEFATLEAVLSESVVKHPAWRGPHVHIRIPKDGIEMWARPIRNWIYATGRIPSFEDFVR